MRRSIGERCALRPFVLLPGHRADPTLPVHLRTTGRRLDRYPPAAGRTPDPDPAFDPVEVAIGVGVVALAPIAVVLLRLFPPMLPTAHGVGWVLPVAGGVVSVVVALTMTLGLADGLRRGSERLVIRAAGLGVLAVGLAVATLRAVSPEGVAGFPDGVLSGAATAAGFVLLLAQVGGRLSAPTVRLPLAALLVFVVLEAALAVSLWVMPPGELNPFLLGVGAALVAASAIPGPWIAAGLVTAGLAALAATRPGSIDSLPGLVAIAAGSIAYVRGGAIHRPVDVRAPMEVPAEDAAADASETPMDRAAAAAVTSDDAVRLARELRGTIEELLHARRTIELQREEIAQAATIDRLTGVATRRAILDRLRIEASEARRYRHPVALVLLDLDDFGRLNRERGMSIGDEVLTEVALRLRLRIRAADALGRVGGDSFLVLLPHTDETGAATFADALRRRLLSRPIDTSAGEVAVGVSIGVAFMRAGMALTDEELLATADEALASARAAGGNRIAFDRAHGLIRLEERRTDTQGA